MQAENSQSSARFEQILGLVVLFLLLVGCFIVLRPFLTALMWAAILSFSLWPVHRRLLARLRGHRTTAALITTFAIALLLIGPFVLMGFSVADDARDLGSATRKWIAAGPPHAPPWLGKLPLVGGKATTYWNELAVDARQLIARLKDEAVESAAVTNLLITGTNQVEIVSPATGKVEDSKLVELGGKLINWSRSWLPKAGLAIGKGMTEVGLSVFLAFFFFRHGDAVAARLQAGMGRIAGERGRHLVEVAGNTVRGVVYGILGTAVVQGVMAGIGFSIAGVPGAMLLGMLTFFLSVVPMGPPLVWIPAVIWLFSQGHTGWGIFMLIWGIAVSSIDNVVKPWLISQGSAMPFVLIFFGVIGGALAFGFIGVFLGPTLLAVAYRLIEEWSATSSKAQAEPSVATPAA
jgi:predicted PurR-regulated permease PerM